MKKIALLLLPLVVFAFVSCGSVGHSAPKKAAATAIEPAALIGKTLVGVAEDEGLVLIFNADGSLVYKNKDAESLGSWSYDESSFMYPYTIQWKQEGKPQGYLMSFRKNEKGIEAFGHWFITDEYKTISWTLQFAD